MHSNVTTIGRLKLRKILPEGYNNVDRPLNSKELSGLLTRIAKDSTGSDYAHMLRDLTNFGFEAAHTYGGVASIHLDDLRLPPELEAMRKAIKRKIYLISQRRDMDSKAKNELIIKTVKEATPAIDKAVMDALGNHENSFGLLVSTGSKGKPQQLRQLVFGDLLTVDSKMRDIPYPTFRSYGEGVSPLQYWTASHGGRYGYIQVQKATADAGYFSKQTRGVVHRQVITADDCHRARPYVMSADDQNAIGSLLFADTKGESGKVYKANTPITEEILEDLDGNIKTRSSICCGLADGVCSKCAGVRESGRLPDIGDAIGLNGINAGNEQITQMGLCLHENTEVRMANGTVKAIKDIKAGELVMAANMDGKQYPTPVVANHYNGIKEVYRYTFRLGGKRDMRELIATPEHKILKFKYHSNCINKEVLNNTPIIAPVGEVDNKHFAVMAGRELLEPAGRTYDKRALLLGLLLGDGGYTEAVRYVHLSCADPLLVSDIRDYLEDLNLKLVLSQTQYWYRVSIIRDKVEHDPATGRLSQSGDRNPAKRMLKEFDIYGKYAHEKTLPDICETWSNQAIAELLSGLWATDGSIYQAKDCAAPYTALGSTSKELLEQVKRLLEIRFGIYACPISGSDSGRKRTLYKLAINQMSSVYRLLSTLKLPGIKETQRVEALNTLNNLMKRRTRFYLADKAGRKSTEPVGSVPTYDLEIATPEHLFVLANGLIVSNSSKHSGGESVSANRVKRGFAAVEQFINMPENFVGGAGVAPVDGKVRKISEAPQGGTLIHINDDVVHIQAGLEPTVKEGQFVEAGDLVSEGMPNIETITKYKGIGYGRKAFADALYDIMASSGSAVPRKQLEPFARAYIDKVEITDPDGLQGWIYGDIASYTKLEANWKTRKDSYESNVSAASGKYLDKPVLHYTIGTRLTPSIMKDITESGISKVVVNDAEPPFKPIQLSAKQYVAQDEDWITALSGEGLTKSFIQHAQQGSDSKKGSTSYYPDLAFIGTSDEKPLTV